MGGVSDVSAHARGQSKHSPHGGWRGGEEKTSVTKTLIYIFIYTPTLPEAKSGIKCFYIYVLTAHCPELNMKYSHAVNSELGFSQIFILKSQIFPDPEI